MHFLAKYTEISTCILLFMALTKASDPGGTISVSTSPPGGLLPENTPQLILITFDDAVNAVNYDNILKVTGHKNRDGSPMAMTFYVSTDYTDYYLVHRLHAAGHEIAVHTMTHSTGNIYKGPDTSFDTWIREIEGCREALTRYAGIPRDQIIGFRTPYLAYNADTFKALSLLGFSYDTSVPETSPGLNSPDDAHYIWPYTLHDGLKQNPWTGPPPSESLPDLLEVPMWNLIDGESSHNMDPDVASAGEMLAMLKSNFNTRYNGNRVPVGIYFHEGWLTKESNITAMNEFLDWALAQPDVYVVGTGALAEWMRNPVSAETAAAEGTFTVQTYTPVPEDQAIQNTFDGYSFRSVGNRAKVYPAPDTAFLQKKIIPEPVTYRVDITFDWGSGYQADIVAVNAGAKSLNDWQVEMDLGNSRITSFWGPASHTEADGKTTVTPDGWASEITPGEKIIGSFVADGDSATLGTPTGTIWGTGPEPARLIMGTGTNAGHLEWNRVAPIYELQGLANPSTGNWEVLQTLYGRNQIDLPADNPYEFFRLRCIQ